MGIFDTIGKLFQPGPTTSAGTTSNTGATQTSGTTQGGNNVQTTANFSPFLLQELQNLPGAFSPGAAAAGNIAQNGISPGSIAAFQSPYTQQVVDATQHQFDVNNAIQNSQNSGYAAKQGALTGSGAGNLRAQTQMAQQASQAPVIAGLYNTGFNNAANLAGQSAGLRLQGAGTLNSGAAQQAGATTGLVNAGGMNTAGTNFGTTTGNTATQNTGTYNGQTQAQPYSPWQIGSGLFGLASSFFNRGGRVGYAIGGDVAAKSSMPSFHENPKLGKLMGTLEPLMHTMRKAVKNGGKIEGYEDGGDVGLGSWSPMVSGANGGPPSDDRYWDRMQGRAEASPVSSFGSRLASGLDAMNQGMYGRPQQAQTQSSTNPADISPMLKAWMARSMGTQPQTMADGGSPDDADGNVEPSNGGGGFLSSLGLRLPGGVFSGQPMSNGQRFGAALMANGPMSGISSYMTGQAQHDIENALNQRKADLEAARMVGSLNGRPTIEGRTTALAEARNPEQIKALAAQGEEAQIRIKMQEAKNQQQLDFYKQQLLREQDIQDQLAQGIITPQQAEGMRSISRNMPAPGSAFTYDPKSGLTPRQ